MNTIFVKLRRQ